ncbi:MAG: transposase [Proteobacteria bacterium]|nr:transposase [Pseudomonadota bacterium]
MPDIPLEFREQIVALARAGRGPEELAREFEPSAKTIRTWIRQAAGLPMDRVTFVATDFVEKTWLQALTEAGFDKDKKSFFLLEGLVYCLSDSDLEATLCDIASTAPGSCLAFDYLSL